MMAWRRCINGGLQNGDRAFLAALTVAVNVW
jgi:hypothetical protein